MRFHIRHALRIGCVTLLLVLSRCSQACDWDTETLLQERSRFPSVLELIVGKFPRHSQEYYQWRLEDRLAKLELNRTDDRLLDDVAVSHEKLGRYHEAIAVAKEQLERNPDRYESLANLGTFLIHSGKLTDGLVFIERAIEVNPEAHFGREKYQVILVKYVLSRSTESGLALPLRGDDGPTWLEFLRKELAEGSEESLTFEQTKEATNGILGMMRFSRHDSPVLLEVLGDLQLKLGSNQLAYRAYRSAARNAKDASAKKRYEEMASQAISWTISSFQATLDNEITEESIAEDFRKELADGDAWFREVVADEKRWIAAGEAVDVRFNEKYRESPPTAITTDPKPKQRTRAYSPGVSSNTFIKSIAVVIALMVGIALILLFIWSRFTFGTNAKNPR
ncbi:MAG: hypothetical protein AAFU85_27715 [Planctomycetota bacterium]